MNKFLLLTIASVWLAVGSFAQTTCATAVDAVVNTNQAPAQSELWYKFSVGGQPLARYSVNYDSKSLAVRVEIFSGDCGNLTQVSALNMYGEIPAVENDTKTYYIHFTWSGNTPQAFSWELYQSLVVPMTGINVTPKSYNLAFGGNFRIDNVFTINRIPANTTVYPSYEVVLFDCEGILKSDVSVQPNYAYTTSTLQATGSGTAKLVFNALNFVDNIPVSVGRDTVTVNIAAPVLCASATTISAGVNSAQAIQEQWFKFTPAKSGIYAISHAAVTPGNDKISVDWMIYQGDCNNLRRQETVYIENAQLGFRAEAGQTYAIRLYQYGLATFDFTLAEPKSVTGFSLTNKTLELVLSKSYDATYELANLGINFTPADATDKGVSIAVRDASILELNEDGQAIVYKDIIRTKGREGSTYVVFTTNDGGFKDSCLVTVKYAHLTSFALSMHQKTLWLGNGGEYINVNDTSALKVLTAPANATDKSYTVTVRNKGIVKYSSDSYGGSLQAMREGASYVVFTANDGALQDSILISVTRTTSEGSPCTGATVAVLGDNNMPAAEFHTEWFQFTPTETANYGMTNHITKYPQTEFQVYEGQCDNLYWLTEGYAMNVSSHINYNGDYQVGFHGEAGKTCYLKLTTGGYNTPGGGYAYAYKWTLAKVSASISGTVTSNGAAAQGKVELYNSRQTNSGAMQSVNIQANGAYQFDNVGVGTYAVRALTTDGNIAWYGNNKPGYEPYITAIGVSKQETVAGKNIVITPKTPLNEGTAKISGYIIKSEKATPAAAPAVRRVKSASGEPAADITVFLLHNSHVIAYTATSSSGYFEFTGVGAGEYIVSVQVFGLEQEDTEVSVAQDGETVELAYEVSEAGVVGNNNHTNAIETLFVENIQVYPNPVRDELRIKNYELRKEEEIRILDLSGRVVMTAQENRINVSSLPAGVYFVKTGNVTQRFIKK